MKGIVLAGGSGTRLYPVTSSISKQLLPVYDKPMIYYPLSVLMLSGIREILVITTPIDANRFVELLGDGSQWGIELSYAIQEYPRGIAESFIIGQHFIGNKCCALILGDNIFYGHNITDLLSRHKTFDMGATIFSYHVSNPGRYGVVNLDAKGKAVSIEEKPSNPKSHNAVTGLYYYDRQVVEIAKQIKPSARGELEITDINKHYIDQGLMRVVQLGRGYAWLDTGTHESLFEASQFVATLERRQGLKLACLEEIAFRLEYIDRLDLIKMGEKLSKSSYGRYLLAVATE